MIYDDSSEPLDNFFKVTQSYSFHPLSLLSPWHFLTSLASDRLSIWWGPLYSLDPGAILCQWSIVIPYGYISQQNTPRDVKHPLWVEADSLGSTGKWGMAISQKHALRAGGQSDVCPALGLVSGTGPCRASPEERKGSRGAHLGLPPHPTRNAKRKQGQETRDVTAKDRKATLGCLIVKTVSDLWSHFPGSWPTFSYSLVGTTAAPALCEEMLPTLLWHTKLFHTSPHAVLWHGLILMMLSDLKSSFFISSNRLTF